MCVAILQKVGVRIDPQKLDEGAYMNKDGAGYSFWNPNTEKVEIRRALKWEDIRGMFIRDVDEFGGVSPFTIHFRIKSHGLICKENCHPFRMKDGGSFIHNGVIFIPDIPEEQSDTRWFVSKVLDRLPRDWQTDKIWATMVQEMLGGGSKAVGLWPGGEYVIFGATRGQWEDKDGHRTTVEDEKAVWFSNNSCAMPSQWELDRRAGKHQNGYQYSNYGGGNNSSGPKVGSQEPGKNTSIGGTRLLGPGAIDDPLPENARIIPNRRWQDPPRPFDLPEPEFERTGEHSWRHRTPEEITRIVHERQKKEAQQSRLNFFRQEEKLEPEDLASDRNWQAMCIRDSMCPFCTEKFFSPELAQRHADICKEELAVIIRQSKE